MASTYYLVCILTQSTCAGKLKKLTESYGSTFNDIILYTHWWKYIVLSKFPDFSLIFEKNAKFPNFSLTGKMHSNFPWFPEAVGTLSEAVYRAQKFGITLTKNSWY